MSGFTDMEWRFINRNGTDPHRESGDLVHIHLEQAVIEAAIKWHDEEIPFESQLSGPLWDVVDALVKARKASAL